MANSWMTHVKKTMKSEGGKKKTMGKKWFSHVLKTAKSSYKKHGGATNIAGSASPVTGGRKRTSKVRRGLRK